MRPNKRDELVRKALQVFYRDGFHATGMDKLVVETGVSKTSMYKHFRTKGRTHPGGFCGYETRVFATGLFARIR